MNEARVVPGLGENALTTPASVPDAGQKRFTTVRARLALKGFELLETEAGAFIVSRWNLTRECSGLAEVEVFAQQAGVQS